MYVREREREGVCVCGGRGGGWGVPGLAVRKMQWDSNSHCPTAIMLWDTCTFFRIIIADINIHIMGEGGGGS